MPSVIVRNVIRHDFNRPKSEAGFHEVVLPRYLVSSVHPGDEVTVADHDETGPRIRGRVRALVAVIEELPDA